ncbi:MAG: hypothetical protein ACI4KM_10295 [Oscillospiraceae bacterium]
MADINQLSAQVRTLEKEISRLRQEAARESERISQESRNNFQRLKSECEQMLAHDRETTDAVYQELLNDAVQDVRNEAAEKLKETEQRYYALKLFLDEELAKQQEETESLKQIQRDFQKEYETAIEQSRQQAEAQIKKAKAMLYDFDSTEPYEWFPPNNRNFFYEHLETAVQFFNSGIYQAAIGIADSLILSIEIERNRINHLLDRWIKNYVAMKTIMDSEKKLIQQDSRRIDWMGDVLQAEWNLSDSLPDEVISQWINGEYFKYIKAFEELSDKQIIEFDGAVIDVTEESKSHLKRLMRAAKYSGGYSAESMYSTASTASVRLSYESKYLCSMRSRIACYDERCNIKSRLDELFEEIDFSNTINRFENDDAREMLILSYESIYREDQIVYIYIIPVFSELNNKWYNNIGYSFSLDDYQLCKKIGDMLFTGFVNSNSLYEEPGNGLTSDQISGRLKQRFRSAINGHS